MKIAPIKKKYSIHGYVNDLKEIHNLSNANKVAIYSHIRGNFISYEVQILRLTKMPEYLRRAHSSEKIEYYWRNPSNEDWGKYGWTYVNVFSAKRKLKEIIEKYGGSA